VALLIAQTEDFMMTRSLCTGVALTLVLTVFGAPAIAQTGGKVDYVSGGISLDERAGLAARGKEFNLKVVTAAERSGAYLADVRMKVIDTRDAKVLVETTMQGPWLLAQLPPGKYLLEATYEGKTLTRTIAIPGAGQREAYFYWTVADLLDVSRPPEAPPASWTTPSAPKR
jgi:hypothetical protein